MKLTIELDVSDDWAERNNGGVTVDITPQGFNALCDALADVGDVGDVAVAS